MAAGSLQRISGCPPFTFFIANLRAMDHDLLPAAFSSAEGDAGLRRGNEGMR